MTLRYLLDTNVVSQPFRVPTHAVVDIINARARECAISVHVWHELRFGVERSPAGRRRAALESYLRGVVLASFQVLPYDQAAADWLAVDRARLEKKGVGLPVPDAEIAAVARVNGLVLVTHNVRDFKHFDGLVVEDWLTR